MEGLLRQGFAAYQASQSPHPNQGGQQQHQQQQQQQPSYQDTQYQDDQDQGQNQGQNQGQGSLPVDHRHAAQVANEDSGDSGNSEMFSQAMSFLGGGNHSGNVNEEHVTQAHQQVYGGGDPTSVSASALGSAAAMQAFKNFTTSGGQSGSNSSGGDMQSKLIGMAMSEATKMFDQSGHPGDKQEAVNGAAVTMFKLMVQSKLSGGGSGSGGGLASLMGGSNSGGLGSMMGMASKFLN